MLKLEILEEISEGFEISGFRRDWVENSSNTRDDIKQVYIFLKKLGLSDSKISTNAHLLAFNSDTIDRNYGRLSSLGLSDKKIISCAYLLGFNPDTIDRNYERLSSLGLSNNKIATLASLLGMNPDTIDRNYENLVGLLRKDYKDRNSGRDLILTNAQLLGNSPDTINANVQYLDSIGIDYNNGFLLSTKPQTKRKKLAWMLRELFDYRDVANEQKKGVIHDLYEFVRNNPNLLTRSIKSLEEGKDKLRKKIFK